jgi:hypothetical protein
MRSGSAAILFSDKEWSTARSPVATALASPTTLLTSSVHASAESSKVRPVGRKTALLNIGAWVDVAGTPREDFVDFNVFSLVSTSAAISEATLGFEDGLNLKFINMGSITPLFKAATLFSDPLAFDMID